MMRTSRSKRPGMPLATVALVLLLPSMAKAQAPTPRFEDGTVNLGAMRGETGHWNSGPGNLSENFVEMDGAYLIDLDGDIDKIAPFHPWAKAMLYERQVTLARDDPHPRCVPNGGPRQFHTPWGLEIVQDRDRDRVLVLSGGGPRSWREIWLDGREHPDLEIYNPTYFGHSVGYWEGDTLVVDTVGFNERFWFARRPAGMPHTEALHLVERISRPDHDTLRYQVTIDDPGAYDRPWNASWEMPWSEYHMSEYFCQDNNQDLEHIVGPLD